MSMCSFVMVHAAARVHGGTVLPRLSTGNIACSLNGSFFVWRVHQALFQWVLISVPSTRKWRLVRITEWFMLEGT